MCFSSAQTRAEAFYKGLIEGIQTANFKDKFSKNLLIIIGDAGNHIKDDVSFAQVEEALEGKSVTIFGLQTNNGAHSSYLDFTQDLIKLSQLGIESRTWTEESESKFTLKSSNSDLRQS